jgi:N-acetyl-anhydromuramyl-L-alanine amidase AmpD
MEIKKQILTVNHRKGRAFNNKRYVVQGICNHISAGLRGSVINWFNNPSAQASYHYLVCKNGDIIQFVNDGDTAWSQGLINRPTAKIYFDNNKVNPNVYLVSISHEVTGSEPLTELQYQSSLWLHNELINKYNIPIDRHHIIGHYELDSVNRANDPNKNFPWNRLINDLKKIKKQTNKRQEEWKFKGIDTLYKKKLLNSPDYWSERINDNMPVWAVTIMLSNIVEYFEDKLKNK